MKKISQTILITFLTSSCSTFHEPKTTQLKTLKSEFVNYWNEAKNLSPEDIKTHKKIFNKYFFSEDNYQFMLDTVFSGPRNKTAARIDKELEADLKYYIPLFYSSNEKIIQTFDSFEQKVSLQLKAFSKKIPDFKYKDLPVYGIISLGRTLGGFRKHKGKPILTIGIDQFIKTGNVDLSILFSHEAFHAYHRQVSTISKEDERADKRVLLSAAYREGIATYASGYLNPQKGNLKYISTNLRKVCTSGQWKKHVPAFLKDSNQFSFDDYIENNTLYSKWFELGRGRKYPFSEETGYCIGERAINELAKKYPLSTITKWNLKKVHLEMEQVLRKI